MKIKYNWQLADWPKFTFDGAGLGKLVAEYSKLSAHLQGQVSQLDQRNKSEAYIYLMVEEAIKTSEIEGENLNREEVRSSIARYLDLDFSQPKGIYQKEAGIASLLVDVREKFTAPLSKELLCRWHKLMLAGQEPDYARKGISIGDYRSGPVEIVSGPEGYEIIIFEGPPGNVVEGEMETFISWYNAHSLISGGPDSLPGPILAAIAHMWFTSIHPFGDGNGRIARAISEHALFGDFDNPSLFSLSTIIKNKRSEYYEMLAQSSRVAPTTDLTGWVNWFVKTTRDAQLDAKQKIHFILKKSVFWETHKDTVINKRQTKVIGKFFEFGKDGLITSGINSEKYRAITRCSSATATRDLTDMVKKQMLLPSPSGGRSTRYFIILTDEKPVFNIAPNTDDKKLKDISLNKLADDIQRNIDFHQEPNKRLECLVEKFKQFANGDEAWLQRLNDILMQL